MVIAVVFSLVAALSAAPSARAFDVTTHHYDALRTGWNSSETILTPANVGSSSFKLIAHTTVDEQVDAQPLVRLNQAIKDKGIHTVVYVATENNTIYAIDGETGAHLLSRHLAEPVPYAMTPGYCNNNSQVIGIGATPVIDPSTGILYVVADTVEADAPTFRLYALKLYDLSDAAPSVIIQASQTLSNGSTYQFHPSVSRSRSALLLSNGNVYAGFASYCDHSVKKMRGWILGWSASTLVALPNDWLTNKDATSPNDFFLTSVWMSGNGIASDGSSIYFVTGNSDRSGNTWTTPGNLTESVVELSLNLATLQSSFTPAWYPDLDQHDLDFGSGGIMLLPAQAGSIPALATAMGKDGQLFLMNRAALGGYASRNAVLGQYKGGPCWCGESYFTGSDGINRVVSSGGGLLQTWQVQTSPSPALVKDAWSQSIKSGQDPGFFTTVSSSGKTSGIIWAVGRSDGSNNNAVYLDAFDANTGHRLVTNMIAGYWPNTNANANLVPVVTNGKVYVASYKKLAIFGLKPLSNATATIEPIPAPQFDLPPDLHRITGNKVSVADSKIVLSTRSGTQVIVNATEAINSGYFSVSGNTLTAVGQYSADGTLFAQAINRAKTDPALWLPDR